MVFTLILALEFEFMLLLESGSDPRPFKWTQILRNDNGSVLAFLVRMSHYITALVPNITGI